MEQQEQRTSEATPQAKEQLNGHTSPPPAPPRMLFLVRHGQATFNVEGRHPGQLPGIPLTDEGRRQAHQAAVALSALPLSAVVSSPLERARETAEIIAHGWGLPVRSDPRLMDTDVGAWAGRKIDEIAKNDPTWKAFLEKPDEPPAGVERLSDVQRRAIAVVDEIQRDDSLGQYVVLVAHADVLKLILGYYLKTPVTSIRYMNVGNASISALALPKEGTPDVLAVNWTLLPSWLTPPPVARAESPSNVLASEAGHIADAVATRSEATPANAPADASVWP
ncbi:MAG TPA: histidine phosphatase family protein [Ktedonobacterales bacterium]|jgi:probable phosphoglycerate mutase|nr:histidine phosphatase family protein [Ktedonobacterales bacterium]